MPDSTSWKTTTGTVARSAGRVLATTSILLRRNIWIWPLLAAVGLAILGWRVNSVIERQTRETVDSKLKTILDADVKALRVWMESQEETARALVEDPHLVDLATTLTSETDPDVRAQALKQLREDLAPWLEAKDYQGFALITLDGTIAAAERDDVLGLEVNPEQFDESIQTVLSRGSLVTRPGKSRVLLTDKNGAVRAGVPTMFVLARVDGDDGEPVAVLGLRIRPEDDFTEILHIAQPGATGETYAFDANGLLLSQSRFDEELKRISLIPMDVDSILNVQIRDPGGNMVRGHRPNDLPTERPLTRMAAAAVKDGSGVDVEGYRDYRGVPVVGAWTWLDDYGFGVATEIDVAEAYAPVVTLRLALWGLFGLLVAAAVAIFIFTVLVARANREARKAVIEAKQLGQYTLHEKLGAGGMGVVYRANHAMLHRPTAVKFLDVDRTTPESISRFEREVQLTSQLNHPNTIVVHDFGRTPEGVFYYAMEYLDGITLDQLVKEEGAQPDGRVASILRQMCGSLSEAHGMGLVHRDIKPTNVVLNDRGGVPDFVKVLDFGLVKALDGAADMALTTVGTVQGTPLYMSPEATRSPETVGPAGDIYALGAVGYFLLTGSPVFESKNVVQLLTMHAEATPEPPSKRSNRPISADIERIILACLAKHPPDRPESCDAIIEMLDAATVQAVWTTSDARAWWNRRAGRTDESADGLDETQQWD